MGAAIRGYEVPKTADKHYDSFFKTVPSQKDIVAVITGCTTGTGFIAAEAFAKKGGTVIMLNRPSERSTKAFEELKKISADVMSIDCDITSFESVQKAAEKIYASFPHGIHVLANNAGVMAMKDIKVNGYDIQMITNHLGHFLLTKELYPLLVKGAESKGEARIINHTSESRKGTPLQAKYFLGDNQPLGGDGTNARFGRYHQTKLANAVFTYALHDKLSAIGSKVKSLVCHPGLSTTNLQATTSSDGVNSIFMQLLMTQAQSANDGTIPLLTCMTIPSLSSGDFYGPTEGFGWMRGLPKKLVPEPYLHDEASKKLLWDLSEQAIGSKFDI